MRYTPLFSATKHYFWRTILVMKRTIIVRRLLLYCEISSSLARAARHVSDTKQRSHTAVDFVNWHLYVHTTSSNPFPTFDSSLYDKNTPAAKRKAIYNTMVLGSLKFHKHDSSLGKKLEARGLPSTVKDVGRLHAQYGQLSSKIPDHIRYHQVAMVFNAVATSTRSRHATGASGKELECRACGGPSDNVSHLLGSDCVATGARRIFGSCIGYDLHHSSLGASSPWQAAFFFFDATGYRRVAINAIAIFNYAVWLAQVKDFRRMARHPDVVKATSVIVRIALQAWVKVRHSTWIIPVSARGLALTARKRGYGSASNRTAEDKRRAKAETIRIMASLPTDIAF